MRYPPSSPLLPPLLLLLVFSDGEGAGAGGVPLPVRAHAPGWRLDHEVCAAWLVQAALVDDPTDELSAYLTIIISTPLDWHSHWLAGLLRHLPISWRAIEDDGSPPRTLPEVAGSSTVESALIVLSEDDPVSSLNRALQRLSKNSAWMKVVVWLLVSRFGEGRAAHRARLVHMMDALMAVAWHANRWRLVVAVPRIEDPHDGDQGQDAARLVGHVDVYGFDQPLDPSCAKQSVRLLHSCPLAGQARGGSWRPQKERDQRVFFKNLARVNLGGCPLRITAVHVPPWSMAYNASTLFAHNPLDPLLQGMGPCAKREDVGGRSSKPSCSVHMGGVLGTFVSLLAKQLNFAPKVHFTTDVPKAKQDTESETVLGGHVAELVANQTDLTVTASTLTESRLRVVEAVSFPSLSCFSWTVPKWAGQTIGVLRPVVGEFSSAVWAALLLAVPLLGTLLYAATRVRPRLRAQSPPDAGQVVLGVLRMLLDEPAPGRWAWARAAYSVRGVLAILLGTNLVVTTAYKSTLLTTVTLRRPRADIETPAELFASGLRLRMPQVVLSMLRADPHNVEPRLRAGALGNNMGRVTNILEFVDSLVTRRDTAVLDNKQTVRFYRSEALRRDHRDQLHQLKGCYAAFVESPVLFRRGSPLNPSVSWMWLAFDQAGLAKRWLSLLLREPGPVEHGIHRALELRDLVAAFYLLGIGWLLAASSLALEQSCARRQGRRRGLMF